MENTVDTGYIVKALNELVELLGIKEGINSEGLLELVNKGKIRECIKEIAKNLGLPIEINLSYVPKGYRADKANNFQSTHLVKTDWRGRGNEGITAQVSIPHNLPLYGTSGLVGFPIRVRISENCVNYPKTFISVMSHELSHILLATLSSKEANNEIYTDLTPLVLGFSKIIEAGRKTVQVTDLTHTEIITNTTSYGYLDDKQFNFAVTKINKLLERKISQKKTLLAITHRFDKRYKLYRRYLNLFNQAFSYFKLNKNARINPSDSNHVISFFNPVLLDELSFICKKSEERIRKLNKYYTCFAHYTKRNTDILNKNIENTETFISDLESKIKELKRNINILTQYLDSLNKIKVAVNHISIQLSAFF